MDMSQLHSTACTLRLCAVQTAGLKPGGRAGQPFPLAEARVLAPRAPRLGQPWRYFKFMQTSLHVIRRPGRGHVQGGQAS